MVKNKIKNSILLVFALAIMSATVPCIAANIIPVNGVNVAIPP